MDNLYLFLYPIIFFLSVDFLGYLFYRKRVHVFSEKVMAKVLSKNSYIENYRGSIGMNVYNSLDTYDIERNYVTIEVNSKTISVNVSKNRYNDLVKGSQIEILKQVETVSKKRFYFLSIFQKKSLFYTIQEETYFI